MRQHLLPRCYRLSYTLLGQYLGICCAKKKGLNLGQDPWRREKIQHMLLSVSFKTISYDRRRLATYCLQCFSKTYYSSYQEGVEKNPLDLFTSLDLLLVASQSIVLHVDKSGYAVCDHFPIINSNNKLETFNNAVYSTTDHK